MTNLCISCNLKIQDYNGKDYFWSHEYRHSLRDCTTASRKRVYKAFIKAGLALDGESAKHEEIVTRITKSDSRLKRVYGK